ncbi:MBL fold metallo-hydrolase [Desertivirga arenae]|uniref:MBL fold metallo-hydrolase n=1 Tax=Desertivirga arenae TaxID=2810309 RepID=UPI001A9651D1|nr:MBL fold metallo-hydrolase [Pedobacter sp. SYSU D00823]
MQLFTIETGNFKLDGGAMFGVVPKSIWQKTNPADENNLCSLAMRSLLIEDGDRLILVDTGIGNKQSDKFFSYYHLHGGYSLDSSLNSHGLSKDDITDVFLTHLHLDHVGGAVERNEDNLTPTFRNATYWSNEKHWDWALHANDREKASFLKENILPLQESGQLKFIKEEFSPFGDDLQIRFTYGHTEAMMLPLIKYKNQTIVFAADLFPTLGHLPVPYVASYDIFPLTAMEEKKKFLQEAFDNNYILLLEHDALNECISLVETEKGFRAGDIFRLSDL